MKKFLAITLGIGLVGLGSYMAHINVQNITIPDVIFFSTILFITTYKVIEGIQKEA